jgi:hypothetical protein
MTFDGSGTITGLAAGGLPNGTVTAADLAAGAARANFGAGAVLQVVSAISSGVDVTSSTNWTNTSLSLSITPTSATSKILLLSTATVGMGTANVANFAFARNGTQINPGANNWGASFLITGAFGSSYGYPWSENWLDSPATTSAITYAVQFRVDSGGPAAFGGRSTPNAGTAVLIAMEIAA